VESISNFLGAADRNVKISIVNVTNQFNIQNNIIISSNPNSQTTKARRQKRH